MDKLSVWDDQEVKTLFKFVEIKKSEGMPLVQIFAEYAKCTMRQKNSVRNYYYKELANMQENNARAGALGINLSNHIVKKGEPFSKVEEKQVLEQINKLVNDGYSVRKACYSLSGGSVSKMLRLQNKYRSLTKQKGEVSNMGQIIKMPTKAQGLSDEDIKMLFLGLVKLVKKQEQESAKLQYENQIYKANEKLKLAMAELVVKQNSINKLKSEMQILRDEISKQKDDVIKKRIKMATKTHKTAKEAIKAYFDDKTNISANLNERNIKG